MNTLTSGDRHAVAYAMQGFGDYKESDVASGMKARDYKDATDLVTEAYPIALDRAFFNQGQNALYDPQLYEDGSNPTLVARGPNAVCVRYIVRRLTPTECARLQGFADCWGEIEEKTDFTDEEWTFWAGVRNTHAAINGKATKSYTKAQMLAWYNKLRTDSSEYKMWGNGIALPPAVYCMQGISDVLKKTEEN
jgi:DNA (cytosine-5)-methyltransferase 1